MSSSSAIFSKKNDDQEEENRHKQAVRSAFKSRYFSATGSNMDPEKQGKRDTYHIKVYNKRVTFEFDEAIFQLENPSTYDYSLDDQCIVCD